MSNWLLGSNFFSLINGYTGPYVADSIAYLLTFKGNQGTLASNSKLQVSNFLLPFLPKALQRIHLNKTEIIKNKWQGQKILKFKYRFNMHNTELNLIEDYSLETILAKKLNFNIKIGKNMWLRFSKLKLAYWLKIFSNLLKNHSLQINPSFRPEDPNELNIS